MEQDFHGYFRDLKEISEAERLLATGDVAAAYKRAQGFGPTVTTRAPYLKLLARLLFYSGRVEQAEPILEQYLESRPDDYDAWALAYRVRHVSAPRSSGDDVQALGGQLTAKLLLHLERLRGVRSVPLDQTFEDVLCSPVIPDGLRTGLLTFLFRHVLAEQEKASVRERLLRERPDWRAETRVYAAGALMLLAGETAVALDRLIELSSAGAILTSTYPAIIYAINLRIGHGDAVAHRRRHAVLDRLYRDWTVRLAIDIPADRRAPIGRFRPSLRPSRRIAVLSSPLIHHLNAPTNRVLEIATSLRRDYGYDVRIFEGGMLHYRPDPPLPVVDFFNCSNQSMLQERISYDGVEITKWRTFLDDSQYLKFADVAAAIGAFRPDAVVAVGDASPVQSLLAGRFPVVLFPTNSSAPVGPADRYVSLWDQSTLERLAANGAWPAEVAERCVFGAAGVQFPTPDRWLTRGAVIPGASLILTIVGGRLAAEIRGEFARRLGAFLSSRPTVHLLCVGDDNVQRVLGHELAQVAGQVHCRRFERELANLMTGCDVFLNPDRQGGGTSVAIAMGAKCAVLSLASGDGATLLEAADRVADLEAYFARLASLADDPALLPAIGERMARRVDEVLGFRNCMRNLVDTVEAAAAEYRNRLARREPAETP